MTPTPTPTPKRVRLNTYVSAITQANVKSLNAANIARSEGAVVDLAVTDLFEKVAKETKRASK